MVFVPALPPSLRHDIFEYQFILVHAERPLFAVRVLALISSDLSNNTGFCWTRLKEMVVLCTDFPVTFGGS